eukprot:14138270-Ditylum_brightwellii.AAC.1
MEDGNAVRVGAVLNWNVEHQSSLLFVDDTVAVVSSVAITSFSFLPRTTTAAAVLTSCSSSSSKEKEDNAICCGSTN